MKSLLLFMLASPLLGAITNGLLLRKATPGIAGAIATAAASISFLITLVLFSSLLGDAIPISYQFDWFSAGGFSVNWGFVFDPLTAVMCLVVTGIGSFIHLYSIGYMSEDKSPCRYFAYLNFFLFNMLLLITSDNLLVLFVGWEGVGLCSYLLIGFWYEDIKKSAAGTKAFLVNRIGDAAFLIGIFACVSVLGTVNFADMAQGTANLSSENVHLLILATLFLFIGATGKSAQIPLYVWLPDAMAGPTPVSALIHAATMVTAGIYLIARMGFIYALTPEISQIIAIIGALTALFAATIATCQRDIKKVLAYSTVSQLGFMFLALGVGAYTAAVFHLMTHAFFKALLFLGAGSVIHGLSGEQDICQMGGLRKHLPKTFWTFTVGVIAICGLPPLSGFFSKDAILFSALTSPLNPHLNEILWFIGVISSLLTAFYMTRLYILVFFGSYRGKAHPHESPAVMTLPLTVLAIGSIFAGFVGMPHGLHLLPDYLGHFLSTTVPVFREGEAFLGEVGAMGLATVTAIIGVAIAFYFYYPEPARSESMAKKLSPIQSLLANKYWIDEIYDFLLVRPFTKLSAFLARFVDVEIIDGMVLLPGKICRVGATTLSFLQLGSVQFYLWVMVVGALIIYWFSVKGIAI